MASLDDAGFDREEGLLKDVLDELDRERSRRAELEDQVRKLQEEAASIQKQRIDQATEQGNMSQRVFVSMEAQLKGFQEIVDALTLGKPAIAAAAANERSEKVLSANALLRSRMGQGEKKTLRATLPLHVVRLLEVVPWDPRAKQHIFAVEEIFEWQVFREKEWQHQLRFFPTVFKTLPTVKAESSTTNKEDDDILSYKLLSESNTSKDHRSFLSFLAGSEVKSKHRLNHRIFTNDRLTTLYDLDHGYPLPKKDGCVWDWVGGWRISARLLVAASTHNGVDSEGGGNGDNDNRTRVDSGKDGWSYAVQPGDFLLGPSTAMIWDNAGYTMGDRNNLSSTMTTTTHQQKGKTTVPVSPLRTFRRRRWIRQRVLVDYLHASTSTQQFLKAMAENAQLSVAAGKICDQLVETKLALTEAEEKLSMYSSSDTMQHKEDAILKADGIGDDTIDLQTAEQVTDSTRNHFNGSLQVSDHERKSTQSLSAHDAVGSNQNINAKSEGTLLPSVRNNNAPDSMDKFDWKKIGRGAIINKLKPPGL